VSSKSRKRKNQEQRKEVNQIEDDEN